MRLTAMVALLIVGMPIGVAAAQPAPESAADSAARPDRRGPSALEIRDVDGRWLLRLKGRVQVDTAWASDSDAATSDGTPAGTRFGTDHRSELRSIILSAQGEMRDWLRFRAGFVHVAGKNKLSTTFVQFRQAGLRLTLGQLREAVSMEEETGGTNINMMERAAFTDAWDFRRRLGVGLGYETSDVSLEAAIQSDNVAQERGDRDRYVLGARVVYLPVAEKTRMVHLGIYGMSRRRERGHNTPSGPAVSYGQRPDLHAIDRHLVETGPIAATGDRVVGVEFAGLYGPFNASAEAALLTVDSRVAGMSDPHFKGGYVEIGYFITGESRPYRVRQWSYVRPDNPIGAGGFGAVQIVFRIDHLDLQSRRAGIFGGRQTAYLIGVNWHPIEYVKFMVNLGVIDIANAPNFRTPTGNNVVDILGLRGQINW